MSLTEGKGVDPRPGFGFGLTSGEGAGDFRIAVLVQDANLLDSARLRAVMDSVDGEAEVAYVGLPEPYLANVSQDPQAHARPLQPGCSVSLASEASAGTLGCFVEDEDGTYLLSNSHVIAQFNVAPNGAAVMQPGGLDQGDPATDVVAALDRVVPVDATALNLADAAIARLDGIPADVVIPGLGKPGETPATVDSGDTVAKRGRTTGVTTGTVVATNVNLKVKWPVDPVEFADLVVVATEPSDPPFAQPGDSGSLIVRQSDTDPVALLMAGGPVGGRIWVYGIPMSTVLAELSVSMS